MSHKGRPVKWIGADTGWKTGHVVWLDGGEMYRVSNLAMYLLIQHSCGGELELVQEGKLSPWMTREDWEVESE